jgi:hypothetical protein
MPALCKRCFTKLRKQEIACIDGVFTIIEKEKDMCSDCYVIWHEYISKIK